VGVVLKPLSSHAGATAGDCFSGAPELGGRAVEDQTMIDLASGVERVSVLIAGAGPTGLLLAAELERRGVLCKLIEARSEPQHWDRATVIHPRSLEVFESLGLIDRFLEAGTKQRRIKMYSGGQLLGALDLSECGSPYGFNLGLSEEVTESILTDYLYALGGTVHRSARLVGANPHGDGVLADIEEDGNHYHVHAEWIVGCDGAHSWTRELSGVVLEGHDIAAPWAVFDATIQGWTDDFELNVGYLDSVPIILTALPTQRWRVYLRPRSAESNLVEDAVSTIRQYATAAAFIDIANPTRFHCSSKVANRFRSGRMLLAGDAAHLCSPAQGHGMNTGLQDAFNLAWKLALVCEGVADSSLLDSYEAERRPVAEMVARSGDITEQGQMLTDAAERQDRDAGIRATFTDRASRHNEIVAETELNVDYSTSPIVFGGAGSALAAGQRVPNTIPVRSTGHTLVLFGDATTEDSKFASLLDAFRKVVDGSRVFEEVVSVGANHVLDGRGSTTLLVVRPDGYVGMRSERDHLAALERYHRLVTNCDALNVT
jgi:2-polyprenyl-6-methoxyphenol hydroxylase-like FAD-dependent oxidoreductase